MVNLYTVESVLIEILSLSINVLAERVDNMVKVLLNVKNQFNFVSAIAVSFNATGIL